MNKFREIFFLYKNTFVWGFILIVIAALSFTGIYYFGLLEREKEEIVEAKFPDIEEVELNNDEKEKITENNDEEQVDNLFELIKVDIKGKVKNPGVYEVESNYRVIDAIKKAGGFTSDADTSIINLSKKVYDEMVIIIYSKSEVKNIVDIKQNEENKQTACLSNQKLVNGACVIDEEQKNEDSLDKKVSINTDNIEELMKLSGIGEAKAKQIIEYRKTNGDFKNIEDIMKVEGIGESVFEKIKNNITT